MDDEKPEAEKTEPTEEADPVLILQCSLTFSLSDENGQQAAAGEGQAVLDTESLSIQPRFGEALHLPLRDILSISEGDYEVHLTLTSKETLTLRELANILDPTEDPPDAPRTQSFPGETFSVLKEREIRHFGEYRTKTLVLEAWESLHADGPMPEAYDQRMRLEGRSG